MNGRPRSRRARRRRDEFGRFGGRFCLAKFHSRRASAGATMYCCACGKARTLEGLGRPPAYGREGQRANAGSRH